MNSVFRLLIASMFWLVFIGNLFAEEGKKIANDEVKPSVTAQKYWDDRADFILVRRASATGDDVDDLVERFKVLVKKNQGDKIYKLYLATSYGLVARESWFPLTKDKFAKKAMAILDEMLADLPDDSELGYASYASNEIVGLTGVLYASFPNLIYKKANEAHGLLLRTVNDPRFEQANKGFKANVHYSLAKSFLEVKEDKQMAKKHFEAVLALKSGAIDSKKVREYLDTLN